MRKTTTGTMAAMAAISIMVGAGPLAAGQTSPGDAGPEARADVHEAERLEREAAALADYPHRWDEVVELYRKAAEARPEGDPRRSWDLRQAGRIAYYVGQDARALRILRRAGDSALEYGDVVSAANLYLDAAWVAQRRGEGPAAVELRTRAERLARSPLLSRDDGSALRERLAPEAVGSGQE